MFYSHEVLTSRKYGVATVWLVATLGQKSTARKVSRRAILDVDVPKACETIITPEAPMALRLQSSLLYGVSRVYSQQCGYVLVDAQNAQHSIRNLMKVVRIAQLDAEAAKARPDQITLQDDPAFIPGFNFGSLHSDLLDLDIGGILPHRHISDTASLQTAQSQQLSQIGLQLPNSSSLELGEDFQLPGSGSRGLRPSSLLARDEEDFLLPEIDIGLDADGNFIEFDNVPQGHVAGSGGRSLLPSELSAQGSTHGERLSGHLGGAGLQAEQLLPDDDLPLFDDGYILLPPEVGIVSDRYRLLQNYPSSMIDTSSTAAAPQRRRTRVPKVIPLDRNIELRNRDLLAMNTDYTAHMTDDWERIAASKNTAQAKKNAEYYVLGRGIAGVGDGIGRFGIKGPLAEMWSGDNLYLMLTGHERGTKGKKRESEDEDSGAERRVRPRLDGNEPIYQPGDDTLMGNYELEVGREGQEPLEDVSSAMPWNISASIRGSSVARAPTGLPGSAAGSLTRRGSRIVSASPLVGRGLQEGAAPGLTSDPAEFNDFGGLLGEDDFELYGPGAGVDTQTAGQSQWQKAVLDRESNNFLDFLGNAIDEKRNNAVIVGMDMEDVNGVEFEELLPPEDNSRTVAAQALLHVLTLGTKFLILVAQVEAFGAIALEVR